MPEPVPTTKTSRVTFPDFPEPLGVNDLLQAQQAAF